MCAPSLRNWTSKYKSPTIEDMIEEFRSTGRLEIYVDSQNRLLSEVPDAETVTDFGVTLGQGKVNEKHRDTYMSLPCGSQKIIFDKDKDEESDVMEILRIIHDFPKHSSRVNAGDFDNATENHEFHMEMEALENEIDKIVKGKEIIKSDISDYISGIPGLYDTPLKGKRGLGLFDWLTNSKTWYRSKDKMWKEESRRTKDFVKYLKRCNNINTLNKIVKIIKKENIQLPSNQREIRKWFNIAKVNSTRPTTTYTENKDPKVMQDLKSEIYDFRGRFIK